MTNSYQKACIGSLISYEISGDKNISVNNNHISVNFQAHSNLPFDHHEQLHVVVSLTPELTHQMLDRLLDIPEFAEQAVKKLIDAGPEI